MLTSLKEEEQQPFEEVELAAELSELAEEDDTDFTKEENQTSR